MSLEVSKPSPKSPKMLIVEGSTRPQTTPLDPAQLPESLAKQMVWIGWRWLRVQGRWTKPPYSAVTGQKADVTLPEHWSTLPVAINAVEAGRTDGIGIVLQAAGLLGVDLDDCREPGTGELQPWAAKIVTDLDTYAEVSPSGTGVKLLLLATKPGSTCRRGPVEIYDKARYFTLTGQRLPGCPSEPQPRQSELERIYREWLTPREHPTKSVQPTPSVVADEELLAIAFRAKNGSLIRQLWNGDKTGYISDSEADLALCSLLAFYFPDLDRLDRMFRGSGLYRPKWERADYRQSTLTKALASQRESYQPRGSNRATTSEFVASGTATSQLAPSTSAGVPSRAAPAIPDPTEITWDRAPLPLPTLPPVPAFPMEVLPPSIAEYWTQAAESVNVPVDYVAVPGLALLGAAVGRSRSAAIKRNYSKPPLLWCVLIAHPSAGKSPALNLAAAPLWKSEDLWRKTFSQHQLEYELEADRYKLAYELWRKGSCEGEPPEKPVKPTLRQAVLDDATVKAAIRVLRDNPRGVVLAKDELSAFVLSLNQYKGGKGADRQFWLSAWAGAAVKVNRSGDKDAPPLFVPNPFAAVAGALCPEVLPTLRGDTKPGEAPADGFIDRFLMSYPDPLEAVGETWREIPEAVELKYCEVVFRLLGMDLMPPQEGHTTWQPLHLKFNDEAKKVWQEFTTGIAQRQNAIETDDPFRATLGKLREYGL